MAQTKRSAFKPIIQAIKDKLVEDLGWETHNVKILVRDTVPAFGGSQHILLRPQAPVPIPGWEDGAGRVATVWTRDVLCILRTRLSIDTSDDDSEVLLNDDFGHYVIEEAIADSLQMYQPEDELSNILTAQPIRVRPSPVPEKELPEGKGWIVSGFVLGVDYQLDLDQSVQ